MVFCLDAKCVANVSIISISYSFCEKRVVCTVLWMKIIFKCYFVALVCHFSLVIKFSSLAPLSGSFKSSMPPTFKQFSYSYESHDQTNILVIFLNLKFYPFVFPSLSKVLQKKTPEKKWRRNWSFTFDSFASKILYVVVALLWEKYFVYGYPFASASVHLVKLSR